MGANHLKVHVVSVITLHLNVCSVQESFWVEIDSDSHGEYAKLFKHRNILENLVYCLRPR